MAFVNLNTSIPPVVFSSGIPPEIILSTDLNTVGIVVIDAYKNKTFFTTDLDSYDGDVTLFDLRSVVEEYMRENNLTFMNVKLQGGIKDKVHY